MLYNKINEQKDKNQIALIRTGNNNYKTIPNEMNDKKIDDKQNILNIIKDDIEIGKSYEYYGYFDRAKDFYIYAGQGLAEIAIIRNNKYKNENTKKNKEIIIFEKMNDKDRQLFNEITREIEIKDEINKNMERLNKKIKIKNKVLEEKNKKEYFETMLRREDLYPSANA